VSDALKPYVKLLRPHQWVKSSFVFVGVFFDHAWNDPEAVLAAVLAAAAFSLAASAVYVFNDFADRERDRAHPVKCKRPLAAGTVRPATAVALGLFCGVLALVLAWLASPTVMLLIGAYFVMNAAYSLGLKHVAILDVFIIAAGFMLRLLAGTIGIGIAPSQWLLLCGLMITLFLGFAKRRAELYALHVDQAGSHRRVLDEYDPVLLDQMITVCSAGSLVTYSLYTLSPQTIALHGTEQLVWTVPLVLYGMFRYLYLLHRQRGGGDPAAELLADRQILASVVFWIAMVVALLV
jgi:4-hydroxybenzoate polyprenyltransferase